MLTKAAAQAAEFESKFLGLSQIHSLIAAWRCTRVSTAALSVGVLIRFLLGRLKTGLVHHEAVFRLFLEEQSSLTTEDKNQAV